MFHLNRQMLHYIPFFILLVMHVYNILRGNISASFFPFPLNIQNFHLESGMATQWSYLLHFECKNATCISQMIPGILIGVFIVRERYQRKTLIPKLKIKLFLNSQKCFLQNFPSTTVHFSCCVILPTSLSFWHCSY